MKISTRVKLAVVVALFAAVFMVGSAWAAQTADAVKQIIDGVDGLSAAVSGSTITVTGTAAINVNTYNGGYETWPAEDSRDANQHVLLQLGDLTDLTIDWKADLTLTGVVNGNAGNEEGIQVIHFINGTFKLTGGKIDIQTTGTGWNHVIEGGSFATINVSGGTVKGPGDGLTADGGDNATPGTIIVSAGTVDFRNGVAINADSVTVSGGTINGLVSEIAAGREIFTVDVYGTTNSLTPFNIDDPQPILEFTVKSNATWTLSADVLDLRDAKDTFLIESNGTLILSGTGPLDNYGTVTIKEGGKLINNSTINNFSGNTINNQGTLTNNGTIDNKATGKITNTGTIDNTNGTIKNDGVFQSDQTAEQMGGTVTGNNAVEPIDDTTNPSSGSSGCDAGFGMFALAALALPFMRKK